LIKIEKLDDVYVRVFGDASIEQELADFFTYEYPGARFTPQYKARLWDGKVRLYDQLRKTLYVGLIHYVQEFCKRNEYELQIDAALNVQSGISEDYVAGFINSLNPSARGKPITVRDYQQDAVFNAITRERILLLSPTASGKSLIIYSTLRYHLEYGRKVVLIVPSTSLVEQMYADFEDYSSLNGWKTEQHCQKLYSGFPKEFTKDVLITTWQSIYKQPRGWFRQFDVMFGDEAHNFKAKSLTDVMGKMDEIPYRIGTTGTLDNKKVHRLVLEGIFGPVYRVTTTKQLMDSGRLSDLDITCVMIKYPEATREMMKRASYQDEMDFIVTNERRNKFIRNLACKQKGNTLVLFQYVKKHGIPLYEAIAEKAEKEGKQVFFVSGDTIVAHREKIRSIATNTDNCIIVASFGTFSTGINIPSIENIIFASPSKSKIRNLQSIGRGLRLKEGKEKAQLFDLADDLHWKSWKNHTLNHAAERYKTYAEEEFKLKMAEVNLD
jgi:superfamily II DNA or RNA helicase